MVNNKDGLEGGFARNYEELLRLSDIPSELVSRVLDLGNQAIRKTLDGLADDVDNIVGKLTTDQRYLHVAGGTISESGYNTLKPRGDFKFHPDLCHYGVISNRKDVDELKRRQGAEEDMTTEEKGRLSSITNRYNFYELYGPRMRGAEAYKPENQFAMMVIGERIGDSYIFHSYWRDPLCQKSRPESHIFYAVAIPIDEENIPVIHTIAENLADTVQNRKILVENFKTLWPILDRSEGTLRISEKPGDIRIRDLPKAS
ncbi:hypothetical protein KY343_02245 [Candidatus Woesearchaeota archaeon]|nr:hypothetical protein [Candidatus Woesearchaeota archaeon]